MPDVSDLFKMMEAITTGQNVIIQESAEIRRENEEIQRNQREILNRLGGVPNIKSPRPGMS